MGEAVVVPRRLLEEARRRGIDVESRIVELLSWDLGLDPREEARIHLELATRFLDEARQVIERGDAVQASVKLYKVAEECIKAMAEALNLSEACEARSKGRWTLKLLDTVAEKLAKKVDKRVYDDWSHAYFLHVEGFHEARLTIDRVKARARYVEELLEIARNTITRLGEPGEHRASG